MPAIDPSLKVIKSFTYRGATRYFSNRYYFDNLAPADNTKWTTLSDAVTTAERQIYPSAHSVRIVQAVGYDAGSDVPVFSKTYSLTPLGSGWTGPFAPGDAAMLVRYTTAQRSSKNHPIYLFNYYHAVMLASASAPDTVYSSQLTALQTYATSWVTGYSDGAVTHHRCGPNGHTATGQLCDGIVRHRDFPAG